MTISLAATACPSIWNTMAPYVAATVAAAAVFGAAWVSHSAKISEFRNGWISDLRRDIADYMGAAEQWFRKWDEINFLPSEEKTARERDELFPIANAARVILWRIRLRLNPRQNKFKAQDDILLQTLTDLLDPQKVGPKDQEASWHRLANVAIEHAREVLKREWQVTKRFPLFRR
ncbi:hypothetical protein [Acidocella facilis]|uniref:hypothetical protein n=1 Tax=Acidocella facilis TaxID=525 RepID=UPI001F36CBC4|nr:hypothetical protein [Acidocella facilis]